MNNKKIVEERSKITLVGVMQAQHPITKIWIGCSGFCVLLLWIVTLSL